MKINPRLLAGILIPRTITLGQTLALTHEATSNRIGLVTLPIFEP